jgi:hypothetical protein
LIQYTIQLSCLISLSLILHDIKANTLTRLFLSRFSWLLLHLFLYIPLSSRTNYLLSSITIIIFPENFLFFHMPGDMICLVFLMDLVLHPLILFLSLMVPSVLTLTFLPGHDKISCFLRGYLALSPKSLSLRWFIVPLQLNYGTSFICVIPLNP